MLGTNCGFRPWRRESFASVAFLSRPCWAAQSWPTLKLSPPAKKWARLGAGRLLIVTAPRSGLDVTAAPQYRTQYGGQREVSSMK